MATINKRVKFTKASMQKFTEALESGMSVDGAASLCGISRERIGTLLKEGGKVADKLRASINISQGIAEQRLCQRIMETGNARDCLAMLTARFDSWDKRTNMKSNDSNIKAEALLARLQNIPEQVKKRN
tara:strand:+ start:627 stop:1013 length:387 start_codon:yes stop_codon:yes gene_type:complete